jgi:hypothetical protein
MGKWLNKTLRPKIATEGQNHAELEDLARLAEGTLTNEERQRLLGHLNRCGHCYEILQEILRDLAAEDSLKPRPKAWWKRKFVYALAASIALIFIIGSQLVYQSLIQPTAIISTTLALDQELKNILMENSKLEWSDDMRIERLIAALHKKGLRVKQLNRIVLAAPYYQSKSLFGPEESLHIRIDDHVAYLEVKPVE